MRRRRNHHLAGDGEQAVRRLLGCRAVPEAFDQTPLGAQVTEHSAEKPERQAADNNLDAGGQIGFVKDLVEGDHHKACSGPRKQVGPQLFPRQAEKLLVGGGAFGDPPAMPGKHPAPEREKRHHRRVGDHCGARIPEAVEKRSDLGAVNDKHAGEGKIGTDQFKHPENPSFLGGAGSLGKPAFCPAVFGAERSPGAGSLASGGTARSFGRAAICRSLVI